jgi:hypothetical protein
MIDAPTTSTMEVRLSYDEGSAGHKGRIIAGKEGANATDLFGLSEPLKKQFRTDQGKIGINVHTEHFPKLTELILRHVRQCIFHIHHSEKSYIKTFLLVISVIRISPP